MDIWVSSRSRFRETSSNLYRYVRGGYTQGSNSDPRYNLTFIVNNSVKMGKPIIAVAINYRLNGFGFLGGPVIQEQGLTNLGLRDQRLALHWIQVGVS